MEDIFKHQVRLTYGMIAIALLAIVALCGSVVYFNGRFERQMATFEAHQEQNRKEMKELFEKVADDKKLIGQLEAEKAQKQQTIIYRDRQAATETAKVTDPTRTAEQVAEDTHNYWGVLPKFTADGLLAFEVHDVQKFNAGKINEQRLEGNMADLREILKKEEEKSKILQTDLDRALKQVDADKKVIDEGMKVAKAGKWRRIGGAVKNSIAYAALAVAIIRK